MANIKEIKRRIKSISNTKKITKAMEMVAATKMKKAIEAVLKTRTYANLSWTTVLNIASSVNSNKDLHPLLCNRKEDKKIGIVLFTSNRGLCGGFNSAIINKAHQSVLKHCGETGKEIGNRVSKIPEEFIIVGKKGLAVNSWFNYKIVAEFPKLDIAYEVKEVIAIAKLIIDDFLKHKYDKILVAYTDFASVSKQVPRIKQILPIDLNARDDHLGVVGQSAKVGTTKKYIKEKEEKYLHDKKNKYLFTYEPSPEKVLDAMLPRLIEIQLFQALLESNASEHSARMTAMHQATDAANDMVDELTLFYNKARQASITQEIAEISAGAKSMVN
ncbi:MAG: ATP synthase F1 subunit gamma [Patescibacteria group bacterium]